MKINPIGHLVKTNPIQTQYKPNFKGEGGVSVLGDSTCDDKVDFRDFAVMARCWLAGAE